MRKRILLLGAEAEAGRFVAQALAAEGAALALVASSPDAETAFAVQRLARRLNTISQAVDAGNEAAVRVMVRQVSKQLGGLDAIVFCGQTQDQLSHLLKHGAKELARSGSRTFVVVAASGIEIGEAPSGIDVFTVGVAGRTLDQMVAEVAARIAGRPDNG